MLARITHGPIHPNVYTGDIFSDTWDATGGKVVQGAEDLLGKGKDAANAAIQAGTDAANAVGAEIEHLGSELGSLVSSGWSLLSEEAKKAIDALGSGAKWLWEHDPLMSLGARLISGQNVWDALKETASIVLEDVKIFGPYLSYVPGVGSAASAAIAAGVAIANGKRLTDIGMSAIRGALPPGPVQAGFDTASALLHGESISQAALDALGGQYPEARAAVEGAMSVAHGGSPGDAALSTLRGVLPAEVQPAFDAGLAVAKGKRVQDAFMDGAQAMLPAGYQEVFAGARDIMHGKNLMQVAIDQGKAALPPELRTYADTAIALAQGGKLQDVLMAGLQSAIPAEYQGYIAQAQGLLATGKQQVVAAVMGQIPAGTGPSEVLGLARNALGMAQAATGAGVQDALFETALATLKAQIPAGPAMMAFNVVDAVVRGRRLQEVLADVAAQVLPADAQAALAQGRQIIGALQSGQAGNIALQALRAALPAEAQGYVDLALGIFNGQNAAAGAIALARKQLPASMQATFDSALATAGKGQAELDGIVTEAKAAIGPITSFSDVGALLEQVKGELGKHFADAANVATGAPFNPRLAVTKIASAQVTSAASRAVNWFLDAAAQAKALMGRQQIEQLALSVIRDQVPEQYRAVLHQVEALLAGSTPAEIAMGALRSQVPAAATHVLDSVQSVFAGRPPEAMIQDPSVASAVSAVLKARQMVAVKASSSRVSLATDRPNYASMFAAPAASTGGMASDAGALVNMVEQAAAVAAAQATQPVALSLDENQKIYNQAVQDMALRRCQLGAGNPYTGVPLPAAMEADVKAAMAKSCPPSSSSNTALYALGGVVLAGAGYWAYKHSKKSA